MFSASCFVNFSRGQCYENHHLSGKADAGGHGFYGVVKPLDGVVPNRLEMQAKAAVSGNKNLYDFWGHSLYQEVIGCRARTLRI